MIGNQMMDYYVRPQHLYSHSRTCTRSGLCRRPSSLVAFHICYLLDHASVHEISALVTCSNICQTFPATMEILIYCISSAFVEIMLLCIPSSWRFWSMYILRGNDHICVIMFHAYSWPLYSYVPGLLYVFAVICRVVLRYYADWVAGLPFGYLHHFLPGMDL